MTFNKFCPICLANGMRIVPFHGKQPNRVLLLGEGPAFDELRYLIPFIGKSGRELNGQYLPTAGLSREEIRVGNVTLTAFPGFENPKPEEAAECASYHLPDELRKTDPEYIIVLGAVALSVFGDWDMELEHGRPLYNVTYGDWTGTLWPGYHPAAGLRQPRFQLPCREDFEDLWKWRHGRLERAVDQWPNPEYRELRNVDDFKSVIVDPWTRRTGYDDLMDMMFGSCRYTGREVATDTEFHRGKMHCLTFSCAAGTGYLIMGDNHELLGFYRKWLKWVRPLLVFHNYLADQPMYEDAELPVERWVDTMMEAYRMGMFSQGLKVLAYRLAGMVMQDYDDLVAPYARKQATEYLLQAATTILEWYVQDLPWKPGKRVCSGAAKYGGKHIRTEIRFTEPVARKCPLCAWPHVLQPPKMQKSKEGKQFIWDRAAKILIDMEDKPKTNPVERWYKISEEERAVMELMIGSMPRPAITQVSKPELIRYACRDSDATLRIKSPLYRMSAAQSRGIRRSAMPVSAPV